MSRSFLPKLTAMVVFCLMAFDTSAAPDNKEILEKGINAYLNYDFDKAEEYFSELRKPKKKLTEEERLELEEAESKLEIAQNALDRVEKILIIDSLSYPKDSFFNNYRLNTAAGKIGKASDFAFLKTRKRAHMAFSNENEDYLIWSEPDSDGNMVLMESRKLFDDTWDEPVNISELIDFEGEMDYPYLSEDGTMLYFSSVNEETIGGMDIFKAQRDALTGDFLQPLNLGMPYNSPYDDYLMVIDEQTGTGWWATERNSDEGKVTVYVYLLNEMRKNYDPDDENILAYASLENINLNLDEEDIKLKKEKASEIRSISTNRKESPQGIIWNMPDGKTYTSYSDFKNKEAAQAMKNYEALKNQLDNDLEKLENLRKSFNAGYKSAQNVKAIQELETSVEKTRKELKVLRNEIYKKEAGSK